MLAAILADSENTKFNVNELVSPASVLLAAAIAGFVAWWTARTSPHGRLQTLINIYRGWPEGLDGLDTVEKSIAFTLARIRHKDGIPAPPASTRTALEAKAEAKIATLRLKKLATISAGLSSVAALMALVVNGVVPAQPTEAVAIGILWTLVALAIFWK